MLNLFYTRTEAASGSMHQSYADEGLALTIQTSGAQEKVVTGNDRTPLLCSERLEQRQRSVARLRAPGCLDAEKRKSGARLSVTVFFLYGLKTADFICMHVQRQPPAPGL